MARLENGTYEEIVVHLEGELELNALEESDDLPMATMASAATIDRNLLSTGIHTNKGAQCSYCKAISPFWKRRKNWRRKLTKNSSVKYTHHVKPVGEKRPNQKTLARRRCSSTS